MRSAASGPETARKVVAAGRFFLQRRAEAGWLRMTIGVSMTADVIAAEVAAELRDQSWTGRRRN